MEWVTILIVLVILLMLSAEGAEDGVEVVVRFIGFTIGAISWLTLALILYFIFA